MTRLIYHTGTGTYFDANDEVFIIDTKDLGESEVKALNDGDDSVLEFVVEDGRCSRFQYNDLTFGNTVAYSPSAIREEIRESLWESYSTNKDDKTVLEWAEKASNEELDEIASYILQGDHIWSSYTEDLIDGLREGYRWSLDKKDEA